MNQSKLPQTYVFGAEINTGVAANDHALSQVMQFGRLCSDFLASNQPKMFSFECPSNFTIVPKDEDFDVSKEKQKILDALLQYMDAMKAHGLLDYAIRWVETYTDEELDQLKGNIDPEFFSDIVEHSKCSMPLLYIQFKRQNILNVLEKYFSINQYNIKSLFEKGGLVLIQNNSQSSVFHDACSALFQGMGIASYVTIFENHTAKHKILNDTAFLGTALQLLYGEVWYGLYDLDEVVQQLGGEDEAC